MSRNRNSLNIGDIGGRPGKKTPKAAYQALGILLVIVFTIIITYTMNLH